MELYPKSWAENFAADLTVEGERVPFERVLAHHLDVVARLRATSGLTWRSMASLLARAGARRADGGQISADQLRVSYARLMRQAEMRKKMNTSTAMIAAWFAETIPASHGKVNAPACREGSRRMGSNGG
jgi:hypothetical protein